MEVYLPGASTALNAGVVAAIKRKGKMKTRYLYVKDGKRFGIDNYPNFHRSGSIRGMKEKFYGKDASLVRCGSYIYKVPMFLWLMAH